ncbi:MAG TPA: glucokinase [Ruminococcaceae bacterium]|nr:glucokinase [Oscillospiraceae bacterium]
MAYSLGIDIGGTNIKAGVVDGDCNIVASCKIKTNSAQGSGEVLKKIAEAGEAAVKESKIPISEIRWVGMGCPGTCNPETGLVEYSNNLKWENVPLQKTVAEALHIPAYIENDANAAALGEYYAGAAKGSKSAVVITLGTGLGAGIIINGKLFSGSNYAGAEIGHTVLNPDGDQCTCGRKGCFETFCSATALVKYTKRAIEAHPDSFLAEAARQEGRVSGRTAFNAAKSGDKYGKEVVDRFIEYLACGLINTINIFQPDILCIGGGVSNEGDNLLNPLKKRIRQEVYSKNSSHNTKIVLCSLGNKSGIIGAALLGRQYIKQNDRLYEESGT